MKSLFAIQNGGLSDLSEDITSLQASLEAAKGELETWRSRLNNAYAQWPVNHYGGQSESQFNAIVGRYSNNINTFADKVNQLSQQIYDEKNKIASASLVVETKKQEDKVAAAQTPEELLASSRRFSFLAANRPGFDYGLNSINRNALYARDSGLGFDLFGAVVESLKKNAPAAFSGVKGSEVVRSIVPNAGGPSLPKVTLPSWLPKINLPKPLQNAAKRAADLAIKTAKDVAAKKKAADAKKAADNASGVASQTSDFAGSPTPNNSMLWVMGGAAILAIGVYAARGKR